MRKVFIDGRSGTTGLSIFNRLREIPEIEVLTLSDDLRRDEAARKRMLNACDAAILCLPDDEARHAVSLIESDDVIVLDTSTAHRTAPGWTYGFPELSQAQRAAVAASGRIAVPGCHASGFIALVYPLVKSGLIAPDTRLVCHSLTGYSGGGKSMIAQYEDPSRGAFFDAPRQYGLTQKHKHLSEMTKVSGLIKEPIFCPVVADYFCGMEVTVGLFKEDLLNGAAIEDVRECYRAHYAQGAVRYAESDDESGFLAANRYAGDDGMTVGVYGNEARMLLCARFDNLGKGSGAAAVQCLKLALSHLDKKEQ